MKNIIVIILFALPVSLFGQEGKNYLVKNGDTIHCDSVSFKRGSGNVVELNYFVGGVESSIKGKKSCEEITSFCSNDSLFVLMPLLQNPKKYKRHYQLLTNGVVKVYSYHYVQIYKVTDATSKPGSAARRMEDPNHDGYGETHHSDHFTILPDGEIYKINGKNFKKTLYPYFKQCEGFAKSEYAKLDAEKERSLGFEGYFNEMAAYYNSVCN